MRYNPFSPNSIAHVGMFTGRGAEIIAIEKALYQTLHGNPHHFLVEGERGIGKSSLLFLAHKMADGTIGPFQKSGTAFAVLSVDASTATNQIDLVKAIARELKRAVDKAKASVARAREAWEFLSSWEILGVRYHKDGLALDADEARDKLVDQLVDLCSGGSEGFAGIFIYIDEADASAANIGLGAFLKSFLEQLTKRSCHKVLVALAGQPQIIGKLRASHESSPRLFQVISLGPLEYRERKQVVEKGLDQANEKNDRKTIVTADALQLLAELSEGYPHFIQQFSASAFEADFDDTIDVDDVLLGAYEDNGAIQQLGKKYFEEMYHGRISSDDYRTVLNTMAEHADAWVSRKTIIEQSGVRETQVTNALGALKQRQIIVADEARQGFYRLPTKSFAAWINAVKSVEERKGGEPMLFEVLEKD